MYKVMERLFKFNIILCGLLLDCVHTSYYSNGQYADQQYIPNDQFYPHGNVWISNTPNTYDYNNGQMQYQQQQQLSNNGFQSQQQMSSTQYQYPQYQQISNQNENQPQIAQVSSNMDLNAQPSYHFRGQHQQQTQQYPNFQEQYQTSQVRHRDSRQYVASQYQYQDARHQTQEQHVVHHYYQPSQFPVETSQYPVDAQGHAPIYNTHNYESQPQESINQPLEVTSYEIPVNGTDNNIVHELDSNQYQYQQQEQLQLQESGQNSPQYSQLQQTQVEKSKIEESHQEIEEIATNKIQFNETPNNSVQQVDSNQHQRQQEDQQLQEPVLSQLPQAQVEKSEINKSQQQIEDITTYKIQFNETSNNSVQELVSNQQFQEAVHNQLPQAQVEKSEREESQQKIAETFSTVRVIKPETMFDSNIQTEKSQCPPGLHGLLARPGSCLKFIRCSDGTIYQKDCTVNSDVIVSPGNKPETLDNFCGNKTYGIYAHPYDCSKFVNCSPNGKLEKDCDLGTDFNVKLQECGPKHDVQCNPQRTMDSIHSTGIFCPMGVLGQFPYPFSNEQFINCSNSETFVESCPSGTVFSLSKSYCEATNYKHPIIYNAVDNSLKLETHTVISCPVSCNGSYLYPFDPIKYIVCQDSVMQKMSCSSGDVYSVSKGICMNRGETALFDSVRSLEDMQPIDSEILNLLYKQNNKITCPMEALGVFPYPFANTKYIKCADARLLIKRCRPGFLYSISRKLCDIPDHMQSFDTAVPVEIIGSKLDDVDIEVSDGDTNSLECPSGVSDNFVYPFLNTRYTKCSNGVTEIETCLNEAIYSIRQKKCLPRNQVDHQDYVEGIEMALRRFSNDYTLGVSCGPDDVGFYAHPEDWRKYVVCQNGIVTVKRCGVNKIFDMTQHKCVKLYLF